MPVFDLAGVIAGAMKMRISHFLTVVISGKIVKHILVAMMGPGIVGCLSPHDGFLSNGPFLMVGFGSLSKDKEKETMRKFSWILP